jgi:hypothetical protein
MASPMRYKFVPSCIGFVTARSLAYKAAKSRMYRFRMAQEIGSSAKGSLDVAGRPGTLMHMVSLNVESRSGLVKNSFWMDLQPCQRQRHVG